MIARAGGSGHARLSLGFLAQYPPGLSSADGHRLDERGDVLADAARMQADDDYANRIYGRVVRTPSRTWLQYWFWLYYNPKHLLGFGRHEGDWEMVQLGLDRNGEPELLTYAQHERGERKRFSDEAVLKVGDAQPVVFIAPFSHASYFEPGTHFYPGGTDNPDGEVIAPSPRIEPFGSWAAWMGRWGNSDGILWPLSKGKLGGRSPPSPACQAKWTNPDDFHQEASERKPREQRLLWKLGRATYPRELEVRAGIEEQEAVVEYEVQGGTPPTRLLLTVHDSAERREPMLVSHAAKLPQRAGSTRILLPRVPRRGLVRASAFNALRQRSKVVEVRAD